jgi:hypothetical protein
MHINAKVCFLSNKSRYMRISCLGNEPLILLWLVRYELSNCHGAIELTITGLYG